MDVQRGGIGAAEEHAKLLQDSYRRWTGKELVNVREGIPVWEQLYEAPIVILSHGIESDPILNFGNRLGLALWEMEWEAFTNTPSRLTAEPVERAERDRFFQAVSANGYVDDYTGIRISSTGRRFYILQATVWNIVDANDRYRGQAATFSEYKYI
jgi:hypothetical protein